MVLNNSNYLTGHQLSPEQEVWLYSMPKKVQNWEGGKKKKKFHDKELTELVWVKSRWWNKENIQEAFFERFASSFQSSLDIPQWKIDLINSKPKALKIWWISTANVNLCNILESRLLLLSYFCRNLNKLYF